MWLCDRAGEVPPGASKRQGGIWARISGAMALLTYEFQTSTLQNTEGHFFFSSQVGSTFCHQPWEICLLFSKHLRSCSVIELPHTWFPLPRMFFRTLIFQTLIRCFWSYLNAFSSNMHCLATQREIVTSFLLTAHSSHSAETRQWVGILRSWLAACPTFLKTLAIPLGCISIQHTRSFPWLHGSLPLTTELRFKPCFILEMFPRCHGPHTSTLHHTSCLFFLSSPYVYLVYTTHLSSPPHAPVRDLTTYII